jgi:hypothetical protein
MNPTPTGSNTLGPFGYTPTAAQMQAIQQENQQIITEGVLVVGAETIIVISAGTALEAAPAFGYAVGQTGTAVVGLGTGGTLASVNATLPYLVVTGSEFLPPLATSVATSGMLLNNLGVLPENIQEGLESADTVLGAIGNFTSTVGYVNGTGNGIGLTPSLGDLFTAGVGPLVQNANESVNGLNEENASLTSQPSTLSSENLLPNSAVYSGPVQISSGDQSLSGPSLSLNNIGQNSPCPPGFF